MSKYQQFVFEDYAFNKSSGELRLHYSLDGIVNFSETYRFDFDFVDYNEAALERAIELLFFIAGISYFKTYLSPKIVINKGSVDKSLADFLGEVYQKGLGEFFYVNNLDPHTQITFPTTTETLEPITIPKQNGTLVGIGGGKDSLVTIELLRQKLDTIKTWSLNHRQLLSPLVEKVGLEHAWVEREWDPQLLELKNNPEAYNGHVPISAIFAATGTIVAILSGCRDAVVSNEQSANEPTLHYRGVDINHQYSKSQAFEGLFQTTLNHLFGDSTRYYSFLRPLSELRIAEIFAHNAFEKYQEVFSSCNRAYVYGSEHLFWCGVCPKCAFVFLVLTPFIEQKKLEALFNGKNLLLDTSLEPTYKQLLGIEGDKPLECVGEIKESRAAMRLAQQKYPGLSKYVFELPDTYDYKVLGSHLMPEEAYQILLAATKN